MLNLGPTLLGSVFKGESVEFYGNVGVMTLWRLEPKGGMPTLATVVDGASFSPVGPGATTVLGLLVCSWNSSEDTSVIGGDKYFLCLFSFGTCGMVVCDIVAGGSYCSTSINVLVSQAV
jgi:hypothetical protein